MSRTAQTPGRRRTTIWDNPDYEEHTMSEIRSDQPSDDTDAVEDVEGNRMLKRPGLEDTDDDVEGNRMLKRPGLEDSDDDVEGNRMLKQP